MITRRGFALAALGLAAAVSPSAAQKGGPPKLKFELYKDAAGEFRWRLKAGNGAVLATPGQGYKAKADAKAGIDRIKDVANGKLAFEVYEDAKAEHRWRLKAANGQVVASSGEGYKAKADAEKAVDLIKAGAKDAAVEDQTG